MKDYITYKKDKKSNSSILNFFVSELFAEKFK